MASQNNDNKPVKKKRHTYSVSRKGMGGRPRIWKTPEELEKKIDLYYQDCRERGAPLTMSGLAVNLGVDRQTLINYRNRDEFFGTIQKARRFVEASMAEGLLTSSRTVGHIFSLKNNFGWEDKRQIESTHEVKIVNVLESLSAPDEPIDAEIAGAEEGILLD